MNYSDLYAIKSKLEKIYSTIDELGAYDFESDTLKKDLETLTKKLESYESIPSNILSGTSSLRQSDKTISSLLKLTDSFEIFINDIKNKLRIFDDAKKIDQVLINEMSYEDIKPYIEILANDLIDYNNLLKISKPNKNFNSVLETIYKVIKIEIRYTGSSILLNELERLKIDISYLNELLMKDANTLKDKLSSKNKKIIENHISDNTNSLNKDLLLMVSIFEVNYDSKVLKELYKSKNKVLSSKNNYDEYLKIKKQKSKYKDSAKSLINDSSVVFLKRIIPPLLSLSILLGANIAIVKRYKNFNSVSSTIYTTEEGYYNNKQSLERTTNYNEGDVIILDYSSTRIDGSKTVRYYKLDGPLENIDDYKTITLTDDMLINEQTVDTRNQNLRTEHYREYMVIDKLYKDIGDRVILVLINVLISMGWFLLDVLLGLPLEEYADVSTLVTSIVDDGFLFDIKEALDEIKEAIELLKTKDNDVIYSKEEEKRRKKELDKLTKEYDELYQKYLYLKEILDNNKVERKLY